VPLAAKKSLAKCHLTLSNEDDQRKRRSKCVKKLWLHLPSS